MIIIRQSATMAELTHKQKEKGVSIGFVPTMGALHRGHIELIGMAKAATDLTVCSIFVNPTQFNDKGDFVNYPRTVEDDLRLLIAHGTDVLFLPEVADLYPHGTDDLERYDLGALESRLEGRYRPGHFQGVCQVMSRLLDTVRPDRLFMGQKDFQQCMVVDRLLELKGTGARLITCPTIRENDGLAMSSRNLRLTERHRQVAPEIFKTLQAIRRGYGANDPEALKQSAAENLAAKGFRVDYVDIADAETLEPLTRNDTGRPAVALIAAFLGDVRLIDNLLLAGTES